MDEEQIWSIYFAGIVAFKFHPRNILLPLNGLEAEASAVANAAAIADLCLEQHQRRWPVETE